jgi:polyferredoxin
VKGWFATWRWVFVWLTQLLFYGVPWLQWGGRQAVLFDLETQRFYILGLLLYPQDPIFLAALLVLSALALFFFTAVAGRLWCGYTTRRRSTPRSSCGPNAGKGVDAPALQFEKSTFFIPR